MRYPDTNRGRGISLLLQWMSRPNRTNAAGRISVYAEIRPAVILRESIEFVADG